MQIRIPRWLGPALCGSGGALVLAGVVYGAIPGQDGVVHGCYAKSNGALRVIDPAATTCTQKELSISWNQTGPQGPQGIPGNLALAGQSCPVNKFVAGFDMAGPPICLGVMTVQLQTIGVDTAFDIEPARVLAELDAAHHFLF